MSLQCPYCSVHIPLSEITVRKNYPNFESSSDSCMAPLSRINNKEFHESTIKVEFIHCPHCKNYIIRTIGCGSKVKDVNVNILPQSKALIFPDYVPEQIRSDYVEACSIVNLSPKASATLSRRCLQGMIRDFWSIKCATLYEEISALQDKLPISQWRAINALRQLGNIGAHMEKDINLIVDIDSGEAEKLISLIELLIKQWYIDRHEQDELYADIQQINAAKQNKRSTN